MNIAHELRRLADEIERPDPYAGLKEALAQGKALQFWSELDNEWKECVKEMTWCHPPKRYRIKPQEPEEPWTLSRELPGFRSLRDGEEWHFADTWTKERLPDGYRPLLVGEEQQPADEVIFFDDQITSVSCYGSTKPEDMQVPRRTKRPLPLLTPEQVADGWKEHTGGENPAPGKRAERLYRSNRKGDADLSDFYFWSHDACFSDIIAYRVIESDPKPEPWAKEKAAFDAGKRIQFKFKGDEQWSDPVFAPLFDSRRGEYRVHPDDEPKKLVPLGPDDVPPGSVFRITLYEAGYQVPVEVHDEGITFMDDSGVSNKQWVELMENWQINRSLSLGKWDPEAWEPCSKEEAQ